MELSLDFGLAILSRPCEIQTHDQELGVADLNLNCEIGTFDISLERLSSNHTSNIEVIDRDISTLPVRPGPQWYERFPSFYL